MPFESYAGRGLRGLLLLLAATWCPAAASLDAQVPVWTLDPDGVELEDATQPFHRVIDAAVLSDGTIDLRLLGGDDRFVILRAEDELGLESVLLRRVVR